ncbi:MAG: tRNA (pseudouridine(54)-N(1))-methyltransferase TrmY [Halobacteriales archaeon]
MRQFVVLGHEAATSPDFDLDDLAGGAGRIDVLCRCVNAAFLLSHGIREAVELFLVLQDTLTLRLVGSELRYLSPDERNVASLLRSGIEATEGAVGMMEVESTPGIYASKRGFEGVVDGLDGTLIQLHENADPIAEIDPPEDPVFVLSDHREFTDAETDLLEECADARVSLGPEPLHADHAITVAHNALDTGGFRKY